MVIDRYSSVDALDSYTESDAFLASPRYEQYANDAFRFAKHKLKMFNDSPFKHNEKFKENLDQVFYDICVIELMQYEHKEMNSYFNAEWDTDLKRSKSLPDIDYLYNYIDLKIDQLCHWGDTHAYE